MGGEETKLRIGIRYEIKIEPFVKDAYNYNKPHNSLNRFTPVEFERSLLSLQQCQRTLLKIKKIEHNPTILNHLYF